MKIALRICLCVLFLSSPAVHAEPVDMLLTDMHGVQHKLSNYRGKWVVLNYWATWCPPCLEEIPELVHFHENHKDKDGVVIGVDMEELKPGELEDFVEDNFVTYPVIPLTDNMPSLTSVTSYPTTLLIDPSGELVIKHVGAVTSDAIEQFIKSYTLARTNK